MERKTFPFGFKTVEDFNALEKMLRAGGTTLKLDDLKEVIEAYKTYAGNARMASLNLHCISQTTLIRYWRKAGLSIGNGGGVDIKSMATIYDEYLNYVKSGKSADEIAKSKGVSKRAVSIYLKSHPELREIYEAKRKAK